MIYTTRDKDDNIVHYSADGKKFKSLLEITNYVKDNYELLKSYALLQERKMKILNIKKT
jgi:hypothetical protein